MAGSAAIASFGKAASIRWVPIWRNCRRENLMVGRTEGPSMRDDELMITREFAAPLSLVWRLWEDRDHMCRWWGPEAFHVVNLEADFRPGGHWRVHMTNPQFGESFSHGEFKSITPHKEIIF